MVLKPPGKFSVSKHRLRKSEDSVLEIRAPLVLANEAILFGRENCICLRRLLSRVYSVNSKGRRLLPANEEEK